MHVGDRIERDSLELRALIRCNAGLLEEFNDVEAWDSLHLLF